MRRRLALLCAAGFLLRAAVAVADSRRPLFPAHYYNDERDYAAAAALIAEGRARGEKLSSLAPGKELYSHWLALLGRSGADPVLAGRLANASLASAAAGLWGLTAGALAGPAAGAAAAAVLLAWPSAVFHTAQAVKEAPTGFLLAATALLLTDGLRRAGPAAQARFAAAAAAALALGFLRAYLTPLVAAAAAVAAAWSAARPRPGGPRWAAAAAALWLAGAAAAYRPLKAALTERLHAEHRAQAVDIVPAMPTEPGARPPSGLPARAGAYRAALHENLRRWSITNTGRAPESAILPDASVSTWPALAAFLPRAVFYELFMPLPGLYPTEGKPARMLAAAEGVALLALFLLALAGLRRASWDPATVFLAAFFVLAVPPTAFLEFDLGSASRHRLHFFPFLMPFAALALPNGRREP